MRQLYVFGTGHALVTKLYNSCFGIREQDFFLILDAGGGNGILSAMDAMNVPCDAIRALFVTHTHTDHLLGSVWIIRRIGEAIPVFARRADVKRRKIARAHAAHARAKHVPKAGLRKDRTGIVANSLAFVSLEHGRSLL